MRQHFSDFTHIEQHLDSLGLFHMDMGLDRMRHALSALGLVRPPFVTVQVLGTNGKGSTASFLASLCAAHGLRAGLYTSPHFVSPTERIRIDGRPWPQELWAAQANKVMDAAPALTYFEFLTVLALLAFAEERVDVAILEAGLGGSHRTRAGRGWPAVGGPGRIIGNGSGQGAHDRLSSTMALARSRLDCNCCAWRANSGPSMKSAGRG